MPSADRAEARYELKYVFAAVRRPEVESLVRAHPAGFRAAYPDRRVNNLYFDDAEWSALGDNLAGSSERAKLRLRWYGDDAADAVCRLELKRKHGHRGDKRSCPLPQPLDLRALDTAAVVRTLGGHDLGELRPWLDQLPFPVLFDRYRRAYRLSADGGVRLTLDSEMEYRDVLTSAGSRPRARTPPEDLLVVELKAPVERWRDLVRVARDFPFRWIAFSKYTRGLMAEPPAFW